MQEFGNWIKNADTKTAVLTAALGLTVTAVASRAESIASLYRTQEGGQLIALTVSLAIFIVAVLAMLFFIHAALRPRTEPSAATNRFSWTAVAALSVPPTYFPSESLVKEAWGQAFELSKIAKKKYGAFRWALKLYFLVLIASVGVVGSYSYIAAIHEADQSVGRTNHMHVAT